MNVADVIAQLVFFLIAQDGKSRDGCDELIVTKSFKAGDSASCRGEREIERESQVRIACYGQMQSAGIEDEGTEPVGIEGVLLAHDQIEVVVVRRGARGRKCGLLHH